MGGGISDYKQGERRGNHPFNLSFAEYRRGNQGGMKHIFINSIPSQGRGKCLTFENFFSHNPKQNIQIFMKHICSISKQNIFLGEYSIKSLSWTGINFKRYKYQTNFQIQGRGHARSFELTRQMNTSGSTNELIIPTFELHII